MAGIYDVLRGQFDLGDQQALLDERLQDIGGVDVGQQLQQPGVDPASVGAESAYTMRRAGMMPNQEGQLVDPYRNIALSREARLQIALEQDKARREEIADSTLFKVGDTLADTGRMFLSPLFWLKGEDTTKYDPSERLKTGYRNQFDALQGLREANVEKFLTSRNARLDAATSLEVSRRNQQIQATSPFEKELMGFAAGSGRPDDYTNPAMRQDLTEQLRLQKGLAMQYGDRVVDRTTHTFVTGRAEKFAQQVSGYKQALQGYNRLKSSLQAGDAFGDIAAIFGFMKMLDPTSVVREGEFAVAASAGGLFARMQIIMQQAEDGQRLTPEMRQEIMDLSNELVDTYNDAYKSKRDGYQKEFKRYQYQDDEINELLGSAPNIDTESSIENINYTVPPATFTGLGIDEDALMKGPDGYKSQSSNNPEVPTYMMSAQ
tara:strand:- start:194 stop:1492 length:1299 start_codon:yes stop_codon:yes gene_type:complete